RGMRGGALADAARARADALPADGESGLRPRAVPGDSRHPRPLAGALLPDLPHRPAAEGAGGGLRRDLRPRVDAPARGARAVSEQGPGLLSRPWVRIACAVLGTGVLVLAVWAAGARAVLASLGASVHALPALALLEAVMVGCS